MLFPVAQHLTGKVQIPSARNVLRGEAVAIGASSSRSGLPPPAVSRPFWGIRGCEMAARGVLIGHTRAVAFTPVGGDL
jgi:hypothetical protein